MEDAGTAPRIVTARQMGYVGCANCGRVHGVPAPAACLRCGRSLAARGDRSLQRVWAWLLAGMLAYVPANLYPMLRTTTLGRTSDSTIIGGVFELLDHGSWAVAGIVFLASVAIPIGKFAAIAFLALSLRRQADGRRDGRHGGRTQEQVRRRFVLYEIVEFVGRWSMIDIFVVAILAALVRLDAAATINPGIAAISFALSVAFTMLAAQSFDPKSIWDPARARVT